MLGLSLVFELWVSLFVRAPILPGFVVEKADDPIEYWSRNNLFEGGRLQGIMGNANLLGPIALLAIIVFAIRFAAGAPRRGAARSAWIGAVGLPLLPRLVGDGATSPPRASPSCSSPCC